MLQHICNVDSYKEAVQRMEAKYGSYTSTINAELDKLQRLPQPGFKDFQQESSNIEAITIFYRWLQNNDKQSIFNDLLIQKLVTKLRWANEERYYNSDITTGEGFRTFLDGIQRRNYGRLKVCPNGEPS